MQTRVLYDKSGITVHQKDGTTVALDPSKPNGCDYVFVSHAHVDHLHRKGGSRSKIIASKETSMIASARGYEMQGSEYADFQLVDTGHILGSRGILTCDDVYYTGDLSVRTREFLKPAKMPRAKTLIIESTFGKPAYSFPATNEVAHKVNVIVSDLYSKGIPVILMGYALGKAQLLTKMFGHWDPVFVHDSVARMNSVYSDLGVNLKETTVYSEAEQQGLLSKHRPWVMIAPLMSGRSSFVKDMKQKYGAVTVGFSGWAVDPRYPYRMGLDYALPMSDHCDYAELVQAVKECAPDKVYTFHGFAEDFAASLKKMGFDAEAIERKSGRAISLDSFS